MKIYFEPLARYVEELEAQGFNLIFDVAHISASPFGDASLIDDWHRERGFREIGYHEVILNGYPKTTRKYIDSLDGALELGRKLDSDHLIEPDEYGAHTFGINRVSIGTCLIAKQGEDITKKQLAKFFKRHGERKSQFEVDNTKLVLTQHSFHDPKKPFCAGLPKEIFEWSYQG